MVNLGTEGEGIFIDCDELNEVLEVQQEETDPTSSTVTTTAEPAVPQLETKIDLNTAQIDAGRVAINRPKQRQNPKQRYVRLRNDRKSQRPRGW